MRTPRRNRLGFTKSNCSQTWMLLALFCAVCLIRTTAASSFSGAFGLDLTTELVYDRSEPPLPHVPHARRDEVSNPLQRRSTTSSSSASLPKTSVSSSPLPSPFDNSLGNNFTAQSCPLFFETFLNSDAFKACLPFSMLLKTSTSFFRASRSSITLTQTLDATCNVDFTGCSALMSSLANQLKLDSNCGADYALQNPQVEMAYGSFVAYQPLYHAGCMVNNASGSFCYADAITNASSPQAAYLYSLPLGFAMPGGPAPPCNACMQNTMAIFAAAAANGSVPALSANYNPAAEQIDIACGPTFVQAGVIIVNAAGSRASPGMWGSISIVSILAAWSLL